jgi:plasmid stabilization system protein ParE
LDEAIAFVARDRPDTATIWLERILDAGESLAELPDRGRIVPEVSRDDVRELIISPYRLIYRHDSGGSRSRWCSMSAVDSVSRMLPDGLEGLSER